MKIFLKTKRKGFSIVEIIVALAVLGIISAPLTVAIVSSMKTTTFSQDQIQMNNVIRIVKENVTTAILNPNTAVYETSSVIVDNVHVVLHNYKDLKVYDTEHIDLESYNNPYREFKFDIDFTDFDGNLLSDGCSYDKSKMIYCNVTVKKGNLQRVIRLAVNISDK